MNAVNRTLYIPLYGRARVSRAGIILHDPAAERIWAVEAFPIRGSARSKWLAYNMAMRARVFDEWTQAQLAEAPDVLVLHVGCGLDSRCERVKAERGMWMDCDLPEVIAARRAHYAETERYRMAALDACCPAQIEALPEARTAIVVMEGLAMYLTGDELNAFFAALRRKYGHLRALLDVYTAMGARASRLKNPVRAVGVTALHGVRDIAAVSGGLRVSGELSFTPEHLVAQLPRGERMIFRLLFTGKAYRALYRLYALDG